MQTVACALDIFQAENKCFLGFLLPTLDSVQIKLKLLRPTVKLADPLVDAILAGLVTRFAGYSEREDLISYWPPLRCLSFGCGGYMMQKRTRTCLVVRICWQSGADCTDYRGQQSLAVSVWVSARRMSSSALILCPQRILTPERKSTCSWLTLPQTACTNFHLVRSFFWKYTTLPSSAPVERLFSLGGQILTPRLNQTDPSSLWTPVVCCEQISG